MNSPPKLTRILINVSRGNGKIYGNIATPSSRPGSGQLATPHHMLQVRPGSVAYAGDTVNDLGLHYVLGDYSRAPEGYVFRMLPLPFYGDVQRIQTVKDPVTLLERASALATVAQTWYDIQPLGEVTDVNASKRRGYRIITGFPLVTGDKIGPNAFTVSGVRVEAGVVIAEAE